MARGRLTLEERIEKAELTVRTAKEKYDAALDELERLLTKRKELDDKKLLQAYHDGDKTVDEIIAFINPGEEPKQKKGRLKGVEG